MATDTTDAERIADALGAFAAFIRHHKPPVRDVEVRAFGSGPAEIDVVPGFAGARDDRLSELDVWTGLIGAADVKVRSHDGREHHSATGCLGSFRVRVVVIVDREQVPA